MRRPRVMIGLLMVAVMLVGTEVSADDRDTAELVDKMLVAVGGEERLEQIETLQITSTGTRWILDEGIRPGDGRGVPGDYDLLLSFDGSSGAVRLDYDIDHSRFGMRQVTEVFDGAGGFIVGQDSNVAPPGARGMTTDRWLSVANHQLLMNPNLLVGRIAAGLLPARLDRSVRLGGVPHDILIADRTFGPPMEIVVNRRTGLIRQIELTESDPLRRDVRVVVRFGLWERVDGLAVPTQATVSYDGQLIQREFRNEIVLNGGLETGFFTAPSGVMPAPFDLVLAERGANSHQHLQSFAALGFPLDGLQLDVIGMELADGVHHLTGGTHHSMLVEHDDGLILVDAPLNEYRAKALLTYIETRFPGESITHLVQSHHHVDHSAGARTIVATGADLVTQRSGARFWSRILRVESTVVPDVPPVVGAAGRILTVTDGGSAFFGSGDNAVGVHSFEQDHADDLVFVVAGGVGFIVDFYNPFPGAPLPPEAQVLVDLSDERDLGVHTIAGGHGAFVRLDG